MLSRNHVLQHRYRIIRPLGRGGMGHVYEAMDDAVDCIVAIKETFANTDKMRRAFEREAKLLANLRHPVLPRVTHHFFEGAGEFLVMDYIEGLNLAELLALRQRPFAFEEVWPWADRLLSALEYLHSRPEPIIHRDIKPANIKLTPEGELYLLDFGLAKGAAGQSSADDSGGLTSSSIFGFTAGYAPLEQLNNSGTSAQSDLYSLGATLYHLLTGKIPPSAAQRYEQLDQDQPDPLIPAHQLNQEVPPSISAVLSQALKMSRRERLATATLMREALAEARLASAATTERRLREMAAATAPEEFRETIPQDKPTPGATLAAPTVNASLAGGSNLPTEINYGVVQVEDLAATMPPANPADLSAPTLSAEPSWPSQITSEARDSQAALEEEQRRQAEAERLAAAQRAAAEQARQEAEAERLRREAEAQRQQEAEERARQEAYAKQQREAAEAEARRAAELAAAQARQREVEEKLAAAARRIREEELRRQQEALRRASEEQEQHTAETPQPNARRKWIIGGIAALVMAGIITLLAIRFSSTERTPPRASASETSAPEKISSGTGQLTNAPPNLSFKRDLQGQQGTAWAVAFSPDGNLIASASEDKKVRLWDAHSWKLIADNVGSHSAGVDSVTFSPDSKTIASASNDQKIYLSTAQTPSAPLQTLTGHTDEVYFVAFAPDGRTLASTSKDQTVKVWEAQSGRELQTLRGHSDIVWSVAFSPDGKILASASKDKTVKVWDTQTWQLLRTLNGHTSAVISLAFSPDGKTLASGSDDNTIKLWDTQTWQEARTLTGHSAYITSLAFSRDGQTLASASNDKTIRLWNAQTGALRQTLTGHSKGVTSVIFSPDGQTLISGSKDETVKVWQ